MVETKQKNATNKQKNNATKQKYNNKGKYYNDKFTWGMSAHFHPWFFLKLSSDTYELRQKNFESVDKKGSVCVCMCLKLKTVGMRFVLKLPAFQHKIRIWYTDKKLSRMRYRNCLNEVCAENCQQLGPYHNNYVSTIPQLCIYFVLSASSCQQLFDKTIKHIKQFIVVYCLHLPSNVDKKFIKN